ncbi:DUF2827 domain-containing protein [Paraburkholderia sp. MMS20-SJTR3]|uniref:DUF2827 domain-containing protein n=1 Tax=Paraburkholderia sejongensis TaxID=2886946 RepID=A0ABS8JZW4_9BURK|nr:DUF2827 domain-containing protein [Paraburkholderia sp. MMS20-SJTR3]MCC8395431.1 DUF2827 domain-containing protein [Paraburkholderia sp. MMS20-SJTR3]
MNAASQSPRDLKVGVSLYVRKGGQSLWENGIFQNCLFLLMLLRNLPSVAEAYIVMGGDGSAQEAQRLVEDVPAPVMTMDEAAEQLDLMIEMSAQLGREWIVRFRERGGKIVSMRVGNDYVIDIERMIFDRPNALLISRAPYHEVWTLPQYEHICAPYYRSAMRVPVRIVPHIWGPLVLERAIDRDPHARDAFGYRPGRRRWRAGIFEPNICMVKTSQIPMLCCEVAHRLNPDALEHVWVYSTLTQKKHAGFAAFAESLDILKHGLATFEGRFPFHQMMTRYVDVVVAHHWENPQNYLYYEALYGGYPLVHNSSMIGACGYRYDDFDCEQGGRALLQAFAEHDANLERYRETAQAFLNTLAPDYGPNIALYGEAIDALYGAASQQA